MCQTFLYRARIIFKFNSMAQNFQGLMNFPSEVVFELPAVYKDVLA